MHVQIQFLERMCVFGQHTFLVFTDGDCRFDDGRCRLASRGLPITQVSLLLLYLLGNYVTHASGRRGLD